MWGLDMKTIYDIQQFLKRFGTIIYIGDRVSDLVLMEEELKELHLSQMIDSREYAAARLILRHEIQFEKEKAQAKNNEKNGK